MLAAGREHGGRGRVSCHVRERSKCCRAVGRAHSFFLRARMAITKKRVKRVVRRYWPLAIAAAILLVLALAWMVVPASEWIEAIGERVAQLGVLAPIIYFVLYVIGTIVLAPSPVMTIAAGVAFGWWGLPLALVSATAGATASFLLSRHFFDDMLEDWVTDRPIFRAAKKAVDKEGWRVLLLLRLSPVVPFGALNYLVGLTKTPVPSYVLWTLIGIVPGTVVDIYIGVVGAKAGTGAQLGYLVVGLVATVILVVLITIKARSYLREVGIKAI